MPIENCDGIKFVNRHSLSHYSNRGNKVVVVIIKSAENVSIFMPAFECSVARRLLAAHHLPWGLVTRPLNESETLTSFPWALPRERVPRGTTYPMQRNKRTPFSLLTKQAHRETSKERLALSSFNLLLRCPSPSFPSIELSLSQPTACFVSTAFKGGQWCYNGE